jgi:hypothetical protein
MLSLERILPCVIMASDHLFLTASTDFALTASTAETALRKDGFEFMQNKTKDLVEFEIEKPAYFRIVIQRRTDPEVGNFFLPSIKAARGCHIDIWLSNDLAIGNNEDSLVKVFLRSLVQSLPTPPWEGLKFRESGKAKKKWKDLLD